MFVTSLVACLAALAGACAAPPAPGKPHYDLNDAPNIYKAFVKTHSKVYDADEYNKRFEIFKESLRRVNELNEKYNQTTFDIYHFADLTKEEMRSYMGFNYSPRNASAAAPAPELRGVTAPAAFDWRDQHIVTPVKNQGGCSCCYIFCAIGNIESQYARKHNQCISLSEQQALDCTENRGCEGGDMVIVMQQLARDEAACMKESDYPYLGRVTHCREEKNKQVVTVKNSEIVNITNEDDLLKLLYTYGPLTVGLDGTDFRNYHGGILVPDSCKHVPDIGHGHAVLLVGYGEEKGEKVWIIKNSWGTVWGENGYVKLQRGVNACGIGTLYTATVEVA